MYIYIYVHVYEHSSPCHPQMQVKGLLYKEVPIFEHPEHHHFFWAKAYLKWTEANWKTDQVEKNKIKFILENMDATSKLKQRVTIQLINFPKNLHL